MTQPDKQQATQMSIEIVKQLYPETYRAIALEAIYAYRKAAAAKRRNQPTKKANTR